MVWRVLCNKAERIDKTKHLSLIDPGYDERPVLEEMDYDERNHRSIVLAAIKARNFMRFTWLDEPLRDDELILTVAMECTNTFWYPDMLKHASKRLRANEKIVTKMVSKNGAALEYADEQLKNNKEIVLIAVKNCGLALQYASKELKNDKDIVSAAVANNRQARYQVIGYASPAMQMQMMAKKFQAHTLG